jgi:ankyrin repeat protein
MTDYGDDNSWSRGRYMSPEEALWRAVRKSDAAEVERILAEKHDGPVDLNCRDNECTMVYVAIKNKDYGIAEALLKVGADVNAPSGYTQFSPFILACEKGDRQAIDLLVKYKADVNARSFAKETGLHRAAWRGDDTLITQLVEDLGADVNAQTDMGQTALFCAISSDLPGTIKTLIELGADQDIEGSIGFGSTTPRAFAAGMEKRQEVVATLDDPSLKETWNNKIYQPVTRKPVAVSRPLTFKTKLQSAQFSRFG